MSKKLNTLKDLLIHQVKDLYSAETQIIDALPKMIKNTSHAKLKKALEDHLEETKTQKERLEKMAKHLKTELGGETCHAIKGIIKEGSEWMKKDADADVMDAGIIASAQRVEHYEIAGYGTAHQFAEQLKLTEVAELLAQTLKEEKKADVKLTKIAVSTVNEDAEA